MSTSNVPSSPAEAEAEAEQARAGLVSTLSRLRENLQPSNVVDEVMSSAKVSASAISEQIWDTARKNPLPALMIGAGLAMIFGFGTRAVSHSTTVRPARAPSGNLPEAGGPEFAAHIARPAEATLAPQRSALGSAYDSVKAQAGDLLDTANDRLAGAASKAASMGRQMPFSSTIGKPMSRSISSNDLMNSVSRVLEDQPLILAAVGIAVGAAIGAAIPQTETENSLLGESSHSVRDAAQDMVQDQYTQLKSVASHAVEDIKQSATEHGLSTDNLTDLVGDVAGKAKSATYEAGKSLDPTKA